MVNYKHMAGSGKSTTKIELVSVRLPIDLLKQLDELKVKEGRDRTAVIVQAVKYWVSVQGKITTDHEYLNRLRVLDENVESINVHLSELNASIDERLRDIRDENSIEIKELRGLLAEQQKTINTLLRMIPKEE